MIFKASRQSGSVLFPNHYCWYIIASSMDIFLTYVILEHFQGWEVNRLANALIGLFGEWGLIGLKFSTVVVVIVICEYVGRRALRSGRLLARFAIAMAALPVGVGLLQLTAWLVGVNTLLGTPEPGVVHMFDGVDLRDDPPR